MVYLYLLWYLLGLSSLVFYWFKKHKTMNVIELTLLMLLSFFGVISAIIVFLDLHGDKIIYNKEGKEN